MGEKIIELQGLRCIAIISVLLFHIWPEIFGNGFLGVDIFFVVSGYIMAMILLSSNSLKETFFTTTLTFYYRRIYRILPLYLLNILATILIVPAVSYTVFYLNFLSQVKSALTFFVNFSMLFENHNYFNNGLTFYWFKHYWSLCVEMQFYAIVPFLLYAGKRLPLIISLFILWPALIGASVFLIFYKLGTEGESGAYFTFTMLPARIYEFLGGFIAFDAQRFIELYFNNYKILLKFKELFYHFITVNLLALTLLGITLYPVKLIDIYTLPAIVVISSILIASIGRTKQKNELKYSILANKFCIFIGDASYSLYICHWIIVTLSKAIFDDNEGNRQIMLLASILVGVMVHLYVEKPIIKARMKPEEFLPYLIGVYFLIGIVASSSLSGASSEPSDLAKDIFHNKSKLILNNTEWNRFASQINPDISAELGVYANKARCNHYPQSEFAAKYAAVGGIVGTELKGSGNLSVLIIGNSHAECVVPGIELALEGIYSELNLFVTGGITPFEGFRYSGTWFLLNEAVKHYKPDIIYFVFKYLPDLEIATEPIEKDFHTIKIQEMIDFLSNNSKVLFISEMHFEAVRFYSLKFSEMIQHSGWMTGLKFKQRDIEDRRIVSTRRWKVIKCKNCIFMNMLKPYCKDGWCSPVDETHKVPLIWDDNHVTTFGSYLLTPYLKEYLKAMYKILENSH
uniref:Acyltransferase n=1 Tax=Panagrolaimus sp. PS1159 TaxID=55785 RepID=A0AC35GUI5_9BILA